jgi:Protein of unknown function (DUF3102)
MSKKIRRNLKVITGELQTAMKGETTNIIAIGGLLIEAQAQLKHGKWLPWLAENFPSSISTAGNYMNAGRLARKFPTVGNLKLRPGALYLLGGEIADPCGLYDRKAMKVILSKAETEWITAERAREIALSLQPPPRPRTTAEIEARNAAIEAARIEAEKEQAEVDSILDGPPPELPATPEVTVHDLIVPPFDQAIKTLVVLQTKPLEKFNGTAHKPNTIRAIGTFLHDVADAVDMQRQKSA